jgi:hypothetical protein
MNTVQIDPAELIAEAGAVPLEHATAAAQPSEGEFIAAEQAPDMEKARQVGVLIAGALCDLAVPAWGVTPEEKTAFGNAIGEAVALWFPGEIPPKYMALVMVGVTGYMIVMKRQDPDTGRLKPRRIEPPKPTQKPTQPNG